MIEAMACGTPVLAFRNGSVPEVIDDGVTGRIVGSMAEAVAALPEVLALDRRAVRRGFDQRFTAGRMARDYVALYERQIAETGRNARRLPSDRLLGADRLRLPSADRAGAELQ